MVSEVKWRGILAVIFEKHEGFICGEVLDVNGFGDGKKV